MSVFEAYADAFPGTMPDSRGMAGEDFDRLKSLMQTALARGSAITKSDLTAPPTQADPELGKVL